MRPLIRLDVRPGVRFGTAFGVRLLCTVAPEVLRIEHPLPIYVVNAPAVRCENGYGFGMFHGNRGKCQIWLAAGLEDEKGKRLSIQEESHQVIHSLAHELAHYEQWRDGRELTERGIAVRARSIIRKFGAHPLVIDVRKILTGK